MKEQIDSSDFDIEKIYLLNKRLLRDLGMLNPFKKSIYKIEEEKKWLFDYLYKYKNSIETLLLKTMALEKSEQFIKELSFQIFDFQIEGLMKNLYDLRDEKKDNPLITIDELLDFFINIQFGVFINKNFIISKISEIDKELINNSKFSSFSTNVDLIEFQDSDNFKQVSASKKIIFLYKLGVIDYLKKIEPFSIDNRLAIYLSQITGEKEGTIQKALSAIHSVRKDDYNANPLLRQKTVKQVESKLAELGVSPSVFFNYDN